MKKEQLAVQLYTCRDLLGTPRQCATTLAQIRDMGYHAVQVAGVGDMDYRELAIILKGEGLQCCATHESSVEILNSPRKIADRLQLLQCQATSYPYPEGVDFSDLASVEKLIRALQISGSILAEEGIKLSYHNHNHEFRRLDGQIILDRIFGQISPEYLQAELDVFWIQYGGGDPVDWCEKMHGRLPGIHLKDYRTNSQNVHEMCEVGSGNLNFSRIIEAAERSGCRWFIVEQDLCLGNPLDSLRSSFRSIVDNLLVA